MKKFMFLGLVVLGLAVYSCGGSSKSASNPNDAAKEFANPTGTLTTANATKVSQAGVEAKGAGSLNSPAGIFSLNKGSPSHFNASKKHGVSSTRALDGSEFADCTTASGNTSTIDWGCVFEHDTETNCTGDGTTKTTAESGSDFFTVEYDGFSVNCGSSETFACDGTINIATDNTLLYCSDVTCTANGDELAFVGCGNAAGELLIHVADDTYVVEDITTADSCVTVTGSIRDSTGSHAVTCDVTSKEDGCSDVTGINTVSHCVIN